jgi:quercetin dioxygenase-like cupin family protein
MIVSVICPENFPAFEHINYKNEVHYVITGSGYFRHGNQEKQLISQGDIVYVTRFEKHEWSNWSGDFKLLAIMS